MVFVPLYSPNFFFPTLPEGTNSPPLSFFFHFSRPPLPFIIAFFPLEGKKASRHTSSHFVFFFYCSFEVSPPFGRRASRNPFPCFLFSSRSFAFCASDASFVCSPMFAPLVEFVLSLLSSFKQPQELPTSLPCDLFLFFSSFTPFCGF